MVFGLRSLGLGTKVEGLQAYDLGVQIFRVHGYPFRAYVGAQRAKKAKHRMGRRTSWKEKRQGRDRRRGDGKSLKFIQRQRHGAQFCLLGTGLHIHVE